MTHVYRVNTPRLLVLPALWLLLSAMLVWGGSRSVDHADLTICVAVAGVLFLIFLPFGWIVWASRLVITESGIEHHQFGYTIHSTWANLQSLSLEVGREGLYLQQPGTQSKLLRWSARSLDSLLRAIGFGPFGGDQDGALAQGRFITLNPFTQHLKIGTLLADLQRDAPHLFQRSKS